MSTPPSLADILTSILNAIQTILAEVATAIADNAGVIASVVVTGFIAFAVMKFGSKMLRGVTGWFRGLI
jgi:hypothetical protein